MGKNQYEKWGTLNFVIFAKNENLSKDTSIVPESFFSI
jgi:hypothetical protein